MASEPEDVEAVIAERRAANPRRSPGRTPAGTAQARRLIVVTAVAVLAATLVLALTAAVSG